CPRRLHLPLLSPPHKKRALSPRATTRWNGGTSLLAPEMDYKSIREARPSDAPAFSRARAQAGVGAGGLEFPGSVGSPRQHGLVKRNGPVARSPGAPPSALGNGGDREPIDHRPARTARNSRGGRDLLRLTRRGGDAGCGKFERALVRRARRCLS